jgi:glycosyltransferase involved in cell wall biosynthesis
MKPLSSPIKIDILCFSSTDWEGNWGSRQQVMLRFARRGYRVLYVEQLAGLEHLLRYPELRKRRLRRWREGLKTLDNNLWIASPPPFLPGRYYSLWINRLNSLIGSRWIRSYKDRLGFDKPLLWVYKPEHGGLLGKLGERLSVYHCIDEWTAGTAGRKRAVIASMETELLQKVDLVFANSPPIYENKRSLNPNTYRIPSGADVDLFSKALEPDYPVHPAIACLPRPRIGYSGTINERLDYAYLEHVARSRPEWSLVLVGDPYPWTLQAPPLQRLKTLPNVYFLGRFQFEEMPSLIKGMDICLLPYVRDERGHYRSPLKLYEYLAAGKPVVSIEQPEANEFAQVIYLASNPDEFVAHALDQDSPRRRKEWLAVAQTNSWKHRVDTMEEIIQRVLSDPG